jgi:hypothetical protein
VKNKNFDEAFILFKFILDSAVMFNSKQLLNINYVLHSTILNVKLENLSLIDLLNIYHYVLHKRNGSTPVDLPTTYESSLAVKAEGPITFSTFYSNGYSREPDDIVDVQEIFDEFHFTTGVCVTTDSFSNKISDQFIQLVGYRNKLRNISDSLEYDTYKFIFNTLVPSKHIINLDQAMVTYTEWFNANPSIAEFITNYTDENNDNYYLDLVRKIYETICPLDYEFIYLNEDAGENVQFVSRITELFKYITSYNINFIHSETDNIQELPLPDLNGYMNTDSYSELINIGDHSTNTVYYVNFFEHAVGVVIVDDKVSKISKITSSTEETIETVTEIYTDVGSKVHEFINCQNNGVVLTEIQ